ncbi:MAG TPA: ATP-dependent RNA helicase HrpA [Kofleriaceae bacterium]|nr:ATP-dependent RNA helicase HrpA [Kofleriaceae bacterium]
MDRPPAAPPTPPTPPTPLRPATPAGGDAPRTALRPGLVLSERIAFPPELPITERIVDIANAIDAHRVVIVAGETGSGKTTQLPKICLAMGRGGGRGVAGQIGCTQPRRIAATSVAARVAQELETELGDVVGYKIRFGDRVKRTSQVKFMTDGILLAEIQSDPRLSRYDTIIVDEAHERSLNIDFLLGFLRELVPRRPELRVIISSATLETERFAAFFGGAPIVEVSGRTYPVDVLYRPPGDDEADLADLVASTVNEIAEMDPRGDMLVFLPGEREIREAASEIERRALPHTMVLPLYARLSAADQQRVFQRTAQRRVVLATNVAETSLTIPGIVYVVDTGLARVNRYSVRTGVSQLLIEPVSKASANQRKGRCGRTASGVCFRLYEEQDFESRPPHTDPEIKRVSLAGVILRMKALRLGDIERFPFLDPPEPRAITEGYRVLEELGALDDDGQLTPVGEQLGQLPLDPRLGRMILGGRDEGALREVVIIAAALGLQDPRERPLAAQQKADESHRKFREEGSDFAGYLKLWSFWQDARAASSRRQLQKLCREHFLSYNRMREWEDIHDQLVRVMREWDFAPNTQPGTAEQIHCALLPGLLSKLGMWSPEARIYFGARQTRFMIHPGSGLAKKPPAWVMAAELVETSQLFARCVAKIDPAWIERAAGPLCRRSHGDPHWEQKQAQVMAKEQVTLYGLPIVRDRKVAYARFDPALCRTMFITHALVRHEYTTKAPFMAHNRQLLDEVQRLRDKARRSDMLVDEYELGEFFDKRLPAGVISGKTFEDWRRTAEADDPRILFLSLADILLGEAHELTPERYPDQIVVGGTALSLAYKFDPSEDDDGATAIVPLAVLPQLDPEVLAWTIPGWHATKLLALLESLPKATRKLLAPLDVLAAELAAVLCPFEGPLLATLERAIRDRTGERVPRDAWDLRAVPAYLGFYFRVVDERDKVLGHGRDLAELQRTLGARAKQVWATVPRERYERAGLVAWDLDELPEKVTLDVGGRRLAAYPALVDAETSVSVRLLESAAAAAAATRDGLRKLFLLQLRTTLGKLEAQLPGSLDKGPLAAAGAELLPRRQLVLRALDDAFRLTDAGAVPRTRAAFAARLAEGRDALSAALAELGLIAAELHAELERVRAAMKPLAGKPGVPRAVYDDVSGQLAHLAPPELLRATPLVRLGHIARYLRAIVVRLQRQANDPQKDQQKAAQVVPLWQRYLARREELRAKGRSLADLDDFGWLLEELRVQTFAPELKTAVPVSPQRLQDAWAIVSR